MCKRPRLVKNSLSQIWREQIRIRMRYKHPLGFQDILHPSIFGCSTGKGTFSTPTPVFVSYNAAAIHRCKFTAITPSRNQNEDPRHCYCTTTVNAMSWFRLAELAVTVAV